MAAAGVERFMTETQGFWAFRGGNMSPRHRLHSAVSHSGVHLKLETRPRPDLFILRAPSAAHGPAAT